MSNPSEDKNGELIRRAEALLAKHGDGAEWFPTDGDDSFDVLNMAQELLDALKASAASSCAATVPTGWKLVPVEPTRDMKKAGALALIGSATHPATSDYRADLVYGAMVKGAPVPESGPSRDIYNCATYGKCGCVGRCVAAPFTPQPCEVKYPAAPTTKSAELIAAEAEMMRRLEKLRAADSTPQPAVSEDKEFVDAMALKPFDAWMRRDLVRLLNIAMRATNDAPQSASAESTHWEEEARRYAQNADFWREKYESARSSNPTHSASTPANEGLDALLAGIEDYLKEKASVVDGDFGPEENMAMNLLRGLRRWQESSALSSNPAPSASAERNPWKDAITDALVCNHIYRKEHDDDPRKALNELLAWEQAVALDPKVSSDAAALVEQGRRSALSSSAATVTEDMADAVRGVLQMLRGKPGATFKDVRVHCSARGDDLSLWPVWIADCDGYVTEEAAARMIYGIMAANAPRSATAPRGSDNSPSESHP